MTSTGAALMRIVRELAAGVEAADAIARFDRAGAGGEVLDLEGRVARLRHDLELLSNRVMIQAFTEERYALGDFADRTAPPRRHRLPPPIVAPPQAITSTARPRARSRLDRPPLLAARGAVLDT